MEKIYLGELMKNIIVKIAAAAFIMSPFAAFAADTAVDQTNELLKGELSAIENIRPSTC